MHPPSVLGGARSSLFRYPFFSELGIEPQDLVHARLVLCHRSIPTLSPLFTVSISRQNLDAVPRLALNILYIPSGLEL